MNHISTTKYFQIKGMHCAGCRSTVEKKLSEIDGVQAVAVSLVDGRAKITYDYHKSNPQQWNKLLTKSGYSITDADISSKFIALREQKKIELKKQFRSLLILGFMAFLMSGHMIWENLILGDDFFVLTFAQYSITGKLVFNVFYHLLPMVLATYCLIGHGLRYVKAIWKFAIGHIANMDTLIGLSVVAAYIYSFLIVSFSSFFTLETEQVIHFFDVVIFVIAFVSIGKYLEEYGKLYTQEEISHLLSLQAKKCFVIKDGQEKEVPVDQVMIGDIVLIKPGMMIGIDGKVVQGNSFVDESSLTGEALANNKQPGDMVMAGTMNQNGVLQIKVVHDASNTMLNKIISIVEQAQSSKAPIEKLVDSITAKFVPGIIIFTIIVFCLWVGIGSWMIGAQSAWSLAFVTSMSILAVACPCALGLATPMALVIGIGQGAKNGILFKNAETIEKIKQIDTVFTDKTGTLTNGDLHVSEFYNVSNYELNRVYDLIGSLEENSTHPIANAMRHYCRDKNYKSLKLSNFLETPGVGVSAEIDGKLYACLNLNRAITENYSLPKDIHHKLTNKSSISTCLVEDKKILAVAFLSDEIKAESFQAVQDLKNRGVKTVILTGDNIFNTQTVAKSLNIEEYHSSLDPIQKMDIVKRAKAEHKKVAMLGDGINDAPALALADIGVAMSVGSDAAIESAQIVFLKGDLAKLNQSFKLSEYTSKVIRNNLIWAFGFNSLAIPIAAGILYPINGLLLDPVWSALLMTFSSLSVVANSLTLKLKKIN